MHRSLTGSWRRRLRAVVPLAVAVLLLSSDPAMAVGTSLYNNWSGQPQWSQDTAFDPPRTIYGVSDEMLHHSESATFLFNGTWFMYHRVFRVMIGGKEAFDIGYSTSTDGGNTWQYGGILLTAASMGAESVSAPKVLVQAGLLTMVFEQDNNLNQPADCAARQRVAVANSTTGTSITAGSARSLFLSGAPWDGYDAGCHKGNVGTPTITWVSGDGYYVTYHGFDGTAQLRRGYYYWPQSVGATNLQYNNWTRRSGVTPMTFTRQDGTGNIIGSVPGDAGVGAADIIRYQGGPGTDDGAYYMVLERFKNGVVCSSAAKNWIVMARATSPQGPWAVQSNALLGVKTDASGNEIGGCGRDMPAWFYQPSTQKYKIVLTKYNPSNGHWGLQRITLA